MTAEAAVGLEEDGLEIAGRELSQRHALTDSKPRPVPSWTGLSAMGDWIRRARNLLADAEGARAKAAEWFLENDYLVQRAVHQIREDLPVGFYGQLPALGGDGERTPRVFAAACCLASCTRLQLTSASVVRFLAAYQRSAPLTIAELWALPTALRLVSLEVLVAALERLEPRLPAPFEPSLGCEVALEDTECVARALGTLRCIDAIPWKDVFRRASVVESTLARDPAGAYPAMDFETADRYRRVVEELARRTVHSEREVAERVVAYSKTRVASDRRRGHIGFWLIGGGRREFERSLGARPTLRDRWTRGLQQYAAGVYGLALGAATLGALALPALYLAQVGASRFQWWIAALVLPLPASVLGVTLVHWLLTRLLPPRVLPKLDFTRGIPAEWTTAVVVPALAASPAEARGLLEQLEAHYLANPDPSAEFVLLSDFRDAPTRSLPDDAEIAETLVAGVRRLNRLHPDGAFHVLHRERLYNRSEGRWMGWERKRGKLEQFNALVLGDPRSPFPVREGPTERLGRVRFVITLDADTSLPRDALGRLAGILAHPLNRPEFDARTGRVTAGYTVVQPRIEIDPRSGNRSRFARLFSGDTAIDIYSHAVSDVYHDLFGSGIYVGKGIYDVAAFHRSLEGRVPENALASHDLFEGIHGRAALATDVVLYESFPTAYLEFARRLHRWIRGDWQLLPWLRRRVPGPGGTRLENPLSGIDRWKILDNLRRSLVSPALMALLAAGWLLLPGDPWLWTTLGVLAPAGHLFTDLVIGLGRGRHRRALRGTLRRASDHAGRWFLLVVFLPHEAGVTLDAVARTLFRLLVSRRGLLQWTTAAHTARAFGAGPSRRVVWREMWAGPLTAALLTGALAALRPGALGVAAPLLVAWAASPEIARHLAAVRRTARAVPLAERDRRKLRQLARRTWLFFESFSGPEDQWLPPDNYQEDPRGVVAHRTSPTNVGMMFTASVTAWDLGYLGAGEWTSRLRSSFHTLERLERHRGHLLNWYDTRSLEPLEPRYVSTVDSGNLAASLLALKECCTEIAAGPLLRRERWDGVVDVLALLESGLAHQPPSEAANIVRRRRLAAESAAAGSDAASWTDALAAFQTTDLDASLHELVARSEGAADLDSLRGLQVWTERLHHQVHHLQHDTESLAPWLGLLAQSPSGALALEVERMLPVELRLDQTEERSNAVRAHLARAEESADAGTAEWIRTLHGAVDRGVRRRAELRRENLEIAAQAESEALGMDFRPLYDPERRLFHIGFNVSADRIDPHHYDLLASEARIASFVAIAKGDAPVEHWFHLGRPITNVGRDACLVSWGGSMFEYLMPALLLRSEPGTLLSESEHAAIEAQRRFGAELGIPWGVSESGFAALDPERSYRYRAFGVPGLGLRRGLASERVIAPYATMLALTREPAEALRNLERLTDLGLLGLYGLYEAADFTPDRIPEGTAFLPVRSYMAHHQGMILAALDNVLFDGLLLKRFESDRRIRSVQVLLHERIPEERPLERLPEQELARHRPEGSAPPSLLPWSPREGSFPELHAIGNGRLASWSTDAGAGGLLWQDHWVTRWSPDLARGDSGPCLYVRDEATGEQWRVAPDGPAEGGQLLFHPHMTELQQRRAELGLHQEIVVAPGDDVELRRITLVNECDRARSLSLTSYAEIALAPAADIERHPAFSKLFVRSEWIEAQRALVFSRRPRDPGERAPTMLQRLIADDPNVQLTGFETDRASFLGRGRDPRDPEGRFRSSEASTGFTLDPVSALRVHLELEPNQTLRLAFATVVAGSRESLLETSERFRTLGAVDWVISDAKAQAAREMQRLGLDSEGAAGLQRLASLLHHPHPALRASAELLEANRSGASKLWGLGISGDLPILLVRTRATEEIGFLRDLIQGHRLWRKHGMKVDLVVLRAGASGYTEPVGERVVALLEELGGPDPLGLHGGVHFLAEDQIGEEQRRLLEVAGRVVLDAGGGPLDRQLARALQAPAELPAFTPGGARSSPAEPTPKLERPSDLRHDNGTGGFSADGSEYVIWLEPGRHTPAPWSNVLANDDFGCLVTESGGGFTWAGNSAENRLTPWANDPVSDPPGEALYLRDEEDGLFWTPTPAPAGADVAHEIRHGAGYTQWRSHSHGLRHELTVFVPRDAPVKLTRLRLENPGSHPRRVTLTCYAEWVLGATRAAAGPFLVPEYESEHHALLVRNPWNADFADRVAFLGASRELHGLTTDRAEFLGRNGSPKTPAALRRWGLSGRVEPGVDPCAAYQVHLDLAPGATEEVVFALGQGRDRDEALALLGRWRDPRNAAEALAAVKSSWDDLLGTVEVHTPVPELDLLLNRWLLYQTFASRVFARTGYYQSSGAIGFRDQLQDLLAAVHVAPERLRAHLLECARHQFEEGDVLHWWHPPAGRGVRTRCSDDLLWLPHATALYVEATGDESILGERVPFLHGPPLAPEEGDRFGSFETGESASLFEHCERALERGITRGPHGLPLIGSGDWNDGMNRIGIDGVGESVWLAWFAASTLNGFADLCHRRHDAKLEKHWRARAAEIASAAEAHGWDGEWYRRAFDDDGQAWGSRASEECRIDSVAQSWAALAGVAQPDRARQALAVADRELVRDDERVVRLLWPPLHATPRDPGYIKAYPPGIRENGGQYTHAAAWLAWGFAELGDGDAAARILQLLNPILLAATAEAADRYRVEPYVVAGDVGSVAPHVGRGGWTWYSGAAAWIWRLAIEGILGIRRSGGGVRIQPCLPRDWRRAEVCVRGPSGSLRICLEDPEGLGSGVAEIRVDGAVAEQPLAIPVDGSERRVQVRIVPGDRGHSPR